MQIFAGEREKSFKRASQREAFLHVLVVPELAVVVVLVPAGKAP